MLAPLRWWGRHFLILELALSVLLTIIFGIWLYAFDGLAYVSTLLQGNRAALFGAIASIFGSLLGFVITATSIVLGFSTSDRLAVVRESAQYPTLWRTFNSTIRALALATIVALVCLLFDRDTAPTTWLVIPLVFVVLLSLLRISRTIWILEQIVGLVTRPPPVR